jgi:uncharacterized protein YqhQ
VSEDLQAQRDSPVGGQAVLEGVMMRGASTWAVAYRPDEGRGDTIVQSFPLTSALPRHRVLRLPLVRGVVALGESLRIGFRALNISANAQLPPEERQVEGGLWVGTIALAVAFAVSLFFLLPAGLTSLLGDPVDNGIVFVVVEKLIRIGIFLVYLTLISRLKHLQRVFEYHGAEHKTIHCYEAGLPLTPENAQRFSRLHPRCGTSFLLLVMIVAIVVFAPLGRLDLPWLFLSRIIGIPLVAGIAFEVLKAFGRNRTKRWARVLMWPGMQLQRMTTREPDLEQLAVAIAAMQAVLEVETPGEPTEDGAADLEVLA